MESNRTNEPAPENLKTADSLTSICRRSIFSEIQSNARLAFNSVPTRAQAPYQSASPTKWREYFMENGSWTENGEYYNKMLPAWTENRIFEFSAYDRKRADSLLLPRKYDDRIRFTPQMAEVSFLTKSLMIHEPKVTLLNQRLNFLDEVRFFMALNEVNYPLHAESAIKIPNLQRRGHQTLLQLSSFKRMVLRHLEQNYPYLKTDNPNAPILERNTSNRDYRAYQAALFPPEFNAKYLWDHPKRIEEEFAKQKANLLEITIKPDEWRASAKADAEAAMKERPLF